MRLKLLTCLFFGEARPRSCQNPNLPKGSGPLEAWDSKAMSPCWHTNMTPYSIRSRPKVYQALVTYYTIQTYRSENRDPMPDYTIQTYRIKILCLFPTRLDMISYSLLVPDYKKTRLYLLYDIADQDLVTSYTIQKHATVTQYDIKSLLIYHRETPLPQ